MIKRIITVVVLTMALGLVTANTVAGEVKPYDEAAFTKAKAAGKTVLLDFHADWCPVCKKQGPIIESLVHEDAFKNTVAFKVNYDTESALKKQFKITSQSTLIVFKGEKAVARSQYVSDENKIRALIEKGL